MEQQNKNDIEELHRAVSLFLIAGGSIKFLLARMSGERNPLELMKLDAEITNRLTNLNVDPKTYNDDLLKADLSIIVSTYESLMKSLEEGSNVQTDSQD